MASDMVIQRQKAAAAVRAALSAWGGEVTPALGERIAAFLKPGEAAFDFDLLQKVMERMVAASLETLIDADKAHIDELAGDVGGRDERDRALQAVRGKLIEIRAIVKGLFGDEHATEIVAIDGRTAMQPEHLWRQGDHTLDRLRDGELQLPQATTAAVGFNRKGLADELEPLVKALRQSIDGVDLDRRQSATTLAAKKAAMSEHDALMGACGRMLTGLHLLAGRADLARRIRVTPPRRKATNPTQSQAKKHDPASRVGNSAPQASGIEESAGDSDRSGGRICQRIDVLDSRESPEVVIRGVDRIAMLDGQGRKMSVGGQIPSLRAMPSSSRASANCRALSRSTPGRTPPRDTGLTR